MRAVSAFGVPCSGQTPLPKDDTSGEGTVACMKEEIFADSRTAQEGGGEEFPGPALVHVDISVFTVMNLAGGGKGNLPQVARAALS